MSESQKLFASVAGALIVHLLLLVLMLFMPLANSRDGFGGVKARPAPREVTVLMGDLLDQVERRPAEALPFAATESNPPDAVAPALARYESDRNTSAASRLKPDEILPSTPGPTLVGGNPLPQVSLVEREYSPGETRAQAATAPAAAAPSAFLPPAPRDERGERGEVAGDPSMTQRVDKNQDEIRESAPAADAETPGTFATEERQSSNNGNTTVAGDDAVDAISTPLGAYKKTVRDIISETWHRYRNEREGLVTWGMLKLEFVVSPTGEVRDLRITKNEANSTLSEFTLRAIRDSQLPPMPPQVIDSVGSEGLTIQYDIIIY